MFLNRLISVLSAIVFAATCAARADAPKQAGRPHIVVILSDDQGWKDVGYHGSEIRTANIDRLAAEGVRLNQFYAQPVCTPTRSSLLTGRYPIRYGLQTMVIRPWADYGLPLEERTLAQSLKEVGYRTAVAGKWHLGHFKQAYLPTRRGFDHQYGHYNGAIDYFTHTRDDGLDWHRQDKPLREEGYSTSLIAKEAVRIIESHDPKKGPLFLYVAFNAPHAKLQATPEYIERYRDIQDRQRRTYAAMVHCMDDGIGQVLAALDARGMRSNSLVFFSSDNGGAAFKGGGANNEPLRGHKGQLYEGGVRVPAVIAWPGHLEAGGLIDQPMHMVDLYPTLLKLAGAPLDQALPLDGLDIWPTLAEGKPSPHREILHNVDSHGGAIRCGDWKLIESYEQPGQKPGTELFNIANDPYEKINLAEKHPDRVEDLRARLQTYAKAAAKARGSYEMVTPPGWKAPDVWEPVD